MAKTQEEIDNTVFATYPVQIGFKAEDSDEIDRYVSIGEAETFAIARSLAYDIAGDLQLPTRWPKPENKQNLDNGWYTSSVQKAKNLSEKHATDVAYESTVDRAVIVSREMRARARVSNIIAELDAVMAESSSTETKLLIKTAISYVAGGQLEPMFIVAGHIGFSPAKDMHDTIINSAASWAVNLQPMTSGVFGYGVLAEGENNGLEAMNLFDFEQILREAGLMVAPQGAEGVVNE